MRRLRVTFPTNLADKDEALRTDIYWEEFQTININEFESAVNEAIKSLSFFPKPIELYNFIRQNAELKYTQNQLEYKEEPISPERAKQILSEIQKIIGSKEENLKPFLEREKAKEFEEKREKLKKQIKRFG